MCPPGHAALRGALTQQAANCGHTEPGMLSTNDAATSHTADPSPTRLITPAHPVEVQRRCSPVTGATDLGASDAAARIRRNLAPEIESKSICALAPSAKGRASARGDR
jgi:hypothetical protein